MFLACNKLIIDAAMAWWLDGIVLMEMMVVRERWAFDSGVPHFAICNL